MHRSNYVWLICIWYKHWKTKTTTNLYPSLWRLINRSNKKMKTRFNRVRKWLNPRRDLLYKSFDEFVIFSKYGVAYTSSTIRYTALKYCNMIGSVSLVILQWVLCYSIYWNEFLPLSDMFPYEIFNCNVYYDTYPRPLRYYVDLQNLKKIIIIFIDIAWFRSRRNSRTANNSHKIIQSLKLWRLTRAL